METLMLTVGDTFPNFTLTAVKPGAEGLKLASAFTEISDASDAGKWKLVFFWPKDFTFVCPTEIVAFARLARDFADRDTVVYGVSTDSEFVHLNWRLHHDDLRDLQIPMLADIKRELSAACGILDKKEGVALRATFLVDPNGVIRFAAVNDLSVGRNPAEVMRVLDALQSDELCPCNWNKGDEYLRPAA
jgi:peroxiredoxin (alkyl hydroperoxide reductase subunit C)